MKLLNITYRLPISIVQHPNEDILIKLSSGGLVSALNSLPDNNYDLHWLGMADFTVSEWESGKAEYEGQFNLHPVFLSDKLNKNFYEGFSNSVLWPLFHYFPSFVEYSEDYWDAYINANRQIAHKAQQVLKPGDIVWIHDYHLLPLAAMLREALPDITIGFFLHTPFPSYELLKMLPRKCKQYLIQGMLGADVVGFQTYDYVYHFLDAVKHIEGIQHNKFSLMFQNRNIRVDAFPISIDYQKFNSAFSEVEVADERNKLRQLYPDMKIIFSVDRLDYSKGIINRLKGYRRFLELNPEWHEKIVFILVLVPSRTGIKKYFERRRMIEELVGSINGKLGNYKWAPIVFQFSSLNYTQLLGLYTGCDVALISPLRDGMNLVAKEFVASRANKQGVLMLSELAGAASELSSALLFNPLDEQEVASSIHKALNMPEEEQTQRLDTMQQQVSKFDVKYWAESFINETAKHQRDKSKTKYFEYNHKRDLLHAYTQSKKRLLVFDYDGTLAPFASQPHLAQPSTETLETLAALAADPCNQVVIASGRDRETLEAWLGHLPITLIAEHGAFIKTEQWQKLIANNALWRKDVKHIMELFTHRCPGAFIEEKTFGIAWHYRNTDNSMGMHKARELVAVLQHYLENTNTVVLAGNKVIEVKSASINKGNALKQAFEVEAYDLCVVIGDDKTDEDMFMAINDYCHAHTIKVGKGSTTAKYRLETVGQVQSLLAQIANRNQTKLLNAETI